MPTLILRLEPLARPRADASPAVVVDLGADGPGAVTTPLARWSASVAASHDGCLVVDHHGAVVSLSAAAAELLGCSDAGVVGRPLLDVVDVVDFDTGASEPDYARRVAPLAVLQGGGGLVRSLLRIRRPDGSRATIDASAAPLHDATGRVVGAVSFVAPVGG